MVKWIREIWSASESIEVERAFGIDQSVERLRAATKHEYAVR